ncbi:MAG: glycerol-3-phosphate 1-O-acyltransferase PlsY [Sedimentisphaerales bacterium]|nr:glycerol-3-phosphate 1-O-acyltransferase PlsY [Sedimentisphaerales bacterium]
MKLTVMMLTAYLVGAIPFGLIIAAGYGIDLRKVGSGNIGATNLSRALGKKWGCLCFILDLAKGLIPTIAANFWLSELSGPTGLLARLAVGCAAIIGHIFPVYLRFKGGKGVATSFGVALGLWPYFTVCAAVGLAVWVVFVLIWRYVSLASLAAAIAFPAALMLAIAFMPDWNMTQLWPLMIAAVCIPILVFVRHRENIKRLLAGTESKVFNKQA